MTMHQPTWLDHGQRIQASSRSVAPTADARVAVYGASSPRTHQVIAALRGRCAAELREPAALHDRPRAPIPHAGADCVVIVLDTYTDRDALERALSRTAGPATPPLVAVAASAALDVPSWPVPHRWAAWLTSTASSVEIRLVVEHITRLAPLRQAGAALTEARHLPPLLRRALALLCTDLHGVASVQSLGERIKCNRSTLWHHWRALWDEPTPPRLQDFVDWVLLYRASVAVSPTRSWAAAAARGPRVHEDTLARMAQRLLGWRLRELGRDGADRFVLEMFNQEILLPILESDATLRPMMRHFAGDAASGETYNTVAIRTAPSSSRAKAL